MSQMFDKHVLPLWIELENGSELEQVVFTTTLVEVLSEWILIGAGHCFEQIEKVCDSGWKIKRAALLDGLRGGAPSRDYFPFEYRRKEVGYLCMDGMSVDYGLIPITPYRYALERNGVVPLNERTWMLSDATPNKFRLCGFVGELTSCDRDTVTATYAEINVAEVAERPEGFAMENCEMFYGRLPDDFEWSVRGMSGGPIFAIDAVDGKIRYWLCAIQSAKLGRDISAYRYLPLAQELANTVSKLRSEMDQPK